ncbi:hypothetical protein BGW36DRAFT_391768 [Talaromyces proteolyticus]|uniref:DUF1275 domain protein n=1 Tax=Talaromyces proteolyticus TaxID=1131652 RepID=A0AAD4KEF5_9EURO|nr:uncharacterized protein BGW36DRAFT_391768 [Talaromyces proteolyticus]KAH8689100.1 hypothetical protein BGW36DRAFT_391768 [Talaromyces proteolyticus]
MTPNNPTPHETDSLLGTTHHSPRSKRRDAVVRHLTTDIDPQHGDILLIFCYIITGLLDSSAVFIWGAFVSMQTGNTVYLGLGLTDAQEGPRWIKSGVSIASFCLGSTFFAAFYRFFKSPRARWLLILSFTIQMLCLVVAAIIVTVEGSTKGPHLTWQILVPLALVAFQSSGQAVTSRVLKFNALSSVVLTSLYCDLFSHPDFVSPATMFRTLEERQRGAAVICMLFGTILGGLWAKSSVGILGALWTAVLLKFLIVLAWLQWRGKKAADEEQ